MLRSLLLLLSLFVGLSHAISCPPQYQLIEGRCIRPLELWAQVILDDEMPGYREECAKDGAHLPIIKNDEENEIFNAIAKSFDEIKDNDIFLLLDLVCNKSTARLEWVDGSPVNYNPQDKVNFFNFDCLSTHQTAISEAQYDEWLLLKTNNKYNYWYTVLCDYDGLFTPTVRTTVASTVTPAVTSTMRPIDGQCGDYMTITNPTDRTKPCFAIYTESISWEDAQTKCATEFASLLTISSADENKFFWRTAISYNMIDGMHIGAHQPNDDTKNWTWIDGEVPISGKAYDNFIGSFPIPGGGQCSSMATENSAAIWINENCRENNQPFMCRRSDFTNIPKSCPSTAPNAGEDFFPPGFPNSDILCEYFLFVTPNKLVELQVLTLVAEPYKDYLEILEGTSGPHLLANLTGTITSTTKVKTVESNVLRVNWKPSGSGSGRGFRIRYNEIDA